MKTIRWILSGLSIALLLSACAGRSLPPGSQESAGAPAEQPADNPADQTNWELAFRDSFPDGNPELKWVPYPFFNQDNLRGGTDPTSPAGQPGVGIIANQNAGGFAALSYADAPTLSDFRLETWIYTTVTGEDRGPLNGVAFRIDPVENRYYRFASHFSSDPSLTFAYVGQDVNNFPVALGTWRGSDIPGGPLAASGWHKLAVEVVGNQAEIYWDSQKLSEGPFVLDRIPSGFVGVYATMAGGLGAAETKVADFTVSRPVP